MTLPVIFGLAGPELTPDEQAFFREVNPAGYILFGRNIEHRRAGHRHAHRRKLQA